MASPNAAPVASAGALPTPGKPASISASKKRALGSSPSEPNAVLSAANSSIATGNSTPQANGSVLGADDELAVAPLEERAAKKAKLERSNGAPSQALQPEPPAPAVVEAVALQPVLEGKTLRGGRQLTTTVPKPTPKPKSDRSKKSKKSRHTASADTPNGPKPDDGFESVAATFELKRRAFFRKHRPVFLALLPHYSQAFTSLVDNYKDGRAEVTPFQQLTQPTNVKGEMKDYQLHGLSFLLYLHVNGINGILGDEMGLGKTLQTLSLLAYCKLETPSNRPHLIICPLSVLSSWMGEIERWTSFRATRFHGEKKERERLKGELQGIGRVNAGSGLPELLVTTYEAYQAEQGWFKSRQWDYVVLDEGHRIKNADTALATALQGIGAAHRLILTGTPLQNNLLELWALLHWLFPQVFHTSTQKAFLDSFNLQNGTYDQSFIRASTQLLNLIMLRRTKEGVQGQLAVPPREEITLYVPLSPCQRFWTKRLLMRTDGAALKDIFGLPKDYSRRRKAKLEESTPSTPAAGPSGVATPAGTEEAEGIDGIDVREEETGVGEGEAEEANGVSEDQKASIMYAVESGKKTGSYARLMSLLMQLRKVCDHPYLMPDSEPEPFGIAEHLVTASAKLVLLDKLLTSLLPKGHRVLIFSGFTSMLDILEDFLNLREIGYLRLDGGTSRPRRNLNIKLYQQGARGGEKSGPPIFLISTRAGGLGINLTNADVVVLFDSSWNPQVDIQAIARAHRIGQTKPVTVYRMICYASVEQQMLSRLVKKKYLSLKILGNGSQSNGQSVDGLANPEGQEHDGPTMSSTELCAILRGGAGALAKPWGSDDNATDGGFAEFEKATFEECVAKGREADARQTAKIAADIGEQADAKALRAAEDEEAELLKGVEQVQSRIFEGKRYDKATKSQRDIGREWQEEVTKQQEAKRIRKDTTVKVQGHAVDIKTVANKRWEAVKTITGDKEALEKLSNKRRVKRQFEHEDLCIHCRQPGEVYLCAWCPRVLHGKCTGMSKAVLQRAQMFSCPGHRCSQCGRSTAEAGGMIFRCQTCPDSYCEDCLPEEDFYSVGDTLPEFELLGYSKTPQAHYIRCGPCQAHFKEYPEYAELWDEEEQRVAEELEEKRAGGNTS